MKQLKSSFPFNLLLLVKPCAYLNTYGKEFSPKVSILQKSKL